MATAQPTLRGSDHHMVFAIPRTASHLLLKLLNLPEQSSICRHSNGLDGYIFLPAASPRFRHSLPGRPIQEWTEEEKASLRDAMQSSFDDWQTLIEEAELQSKSTFVKEHLHWMVDPCAEDSLYGHKKDNSSIATSFQARCTPNEAGDAKEKYNITCLPDAFLLQRIKPTFLIRHPVLAFSSMLRTAIDNQGLSVVMDEWRIQQWECTYLWSLSLYNFYAKSTANFDHRSRVEGINYPIVLDAQDLGNEAIVKTYAKAVGLAEDKVRFTWTAAGADELHNLGKVERRMKSTILASNGVDKGKLYAEDADMIALREGWKSEFGEVLCNRLVKLVDGSMDAYTFLRNKRLRE